MTTKKIDVVTGCEVLTTDKGSILKIKEVSIDGEEFILSFPTHHQWENMKEYILADNEQYNQWARVNKDGSLNLSNLYAIVQRIYKTTSITPRLLIGDVLKTYGFKSKFEKFNMTPAYKMAAFYPALFCKRKNGNIEWMDKAEEFQIFHGGTFYINDEAAGSNPKMKDGTWNCLDNRIRTCSIGDTDGKQDELQWIQVEGGLVCMNAVISNVEGETLLKILK